MKRSDVLFVSALSLLGFFVTTEAIRLHRVDTGVTTSFGSTREDGFVPMDGERTVEVVASRNDDGTTMREIADVRRRLEVGARGTYIDEILAAHDSALSRWPERRTNPLTVWVQPHSNVSDWRSENVAIVRDAFLSWTDAGIPVQFSFVVDSAAADIHVTWTDRFDEQISGKTMWSRDDSWWIQDASIVLAVHHMNGDTLDEDAVRAIALHEVGHLLGLDHTRDTTNIMTPRVRVRSLSAMDRATVQLLYALPPGKIGGSGRRAE